MMLERERVKEGRDMDMQDLHNLTSLAPGQMVSKTLPMSYNKQTCQNVMISGHSRL